MLIYVGNLPKGAGETDLCREGHLPAGTRVRVVKKAMRDGSRTRFGLLQVDPEARARKVMARFDGLRLNGQMLSAREYTHRTAANERRRLDWRSLPWDGPERRLHERRSS